MPMFGRIAIAWSDTYSKFFIKFSINLDKKIKNLVGSGNLS